MAYFHIILFITIVFNAEANPVQSGFQSMFKDFDEMSKAWFITSDDVCAQLVQYSQDDDKLFKDHCERLYPSNIVDAFASDHDISMEYLLVSTNDLEEQNQRMNVSTFSDVYNKVADWQLLLEFNYEAIQLWEQLKTYYQLDDNGIRSKVFEILIKRKPNDIEKSQKNKILEYKSRINNFLNSASIPIYMDLPFKLSFHPFFNQVLIETLVKTFPSRSLGDSRRDVRRFFDQSFFYDTYVIYTLEDMPDSIAESVLRHHRYSYVSQIRDDDSEDSVYSQLNGLIYPDGAEHIHQWGVTRTITNAFYLITIQDFENCKNLGLWPMLGRTYLDKFISLVQSMFFDKFRGRYDLDYYLKNQIKESCGSRMYDTIYSEFFTSFAAGMYLYRSMADGKELSRSRNAYGWWND